MANPSGPTTPARWRARVAGVLGGRTFFLAWRWAALAALAVFAASLGLDLTHAVAHRALVGTVAYDSGLLLALLGLVILVARWGRLADRFFAGLTAVSAVILLAVFAVSVYILYEASLPTIDQFGLGFLGSSSWVPYPPPGIPVAYGGLPAIYGTLVVAGLALLFGVPLSLGIAMFLAELSPRLLRGPLSFLVELLAAIPSVVYGMWGLLVLVPYMHATGDPEIGATLGRLPGIGPAFSPTVEGMSGFNFLTAGIILAIMIVPTVSAVTREAFLAVPQDLREAAMSLGATRWETTRLSVLPYSRRGIFGAIILGLGRAIGETIAVVLVIGNTYAVSTSLLGPGSTIAAWIANEWGEASGLQRDALLELGLVLLVMSLAINIGARFLVRRSSFAVGG
jgi:phosphate transport system permease protein